MLETQHVEEGKDEGEVYYGPYINVLRHMSGPKVSSRWARSRGGDEGVDSYSIYYHCLFVEASHSTLVSVSPLPKSICIKEATHELTGLLIDQKTVTVHHQITFSSFGPGRLNLLDNFIQPNDLAINATDAQILEQHNTWEQMSECSGDSYISLG